MSTIDNYGIQYGTGELFPQDQEGGTTDPNNVTKRRIRGSNQTAVGTIAAGAETPDSNQDLLNSIQMGNLGSGQGLYRRRESNTFYFRGLAVENGLTIRGTSDTIIIGGPEIPELPRLDEYLNSTAAFPASQSDKFLKVSADGTKIEFVDAPTGGMNAIVTNGTGRPHFLTGDGTAGDPLMTWINVNPYNITEETGARAFNIWFETPGTIDNPGHMIIPSTIVDETATISVSGTGIDPVIAGLSTSGPGITNAEAFKFDVKISEDAGNTIEIRDDGLYATGGGAGGVTYTVSDTPSLNLTLAGDDISGAVVISPDAGNSLVERANGLFVPASSGGAVQVPTVETPWYLVGDGTANNKLNVTIEKWIKGYNGSPASHPWTAKQRFLSVAKHPHDEVIVPSPVFAETDSIIVEGDGLEESFIRYGLRATADGTPLTAIRPEFANSKPFELNIKISQEEGNIIEVREDGLWSAGTGAAGPQGPEGSHVTAATVTGDNLILNMSNNTTIDAGNVRGPKGDKGDIGPAGEAGITIIGPLNNVAELDALVDPNVGDGYFIDGNLWVFSEAAEDFVDMGSFKGPKGDQGNQGLQGPPGTNGNDGAPGARGADGDDGEPGEGISAATINNNGHLILTRDKGGSFDAGQVSWTQLKQLTDVNVGTPAAGDNGKALVWDNATSKFVLGTVSGGGSTYTVTDTNSVDLTLTGTAISAAVRRDTVTANNRITESVNGLHVAPVAVQDEGAATVANPSAINFVGAGVTVTNTAGVATVTIPGGGSSGGTGSSSTVMFEIELSDTTTVSAIRDLPTGWSVVSMGSGEFVVAMPSPAFPKMVSMMGKFGAAGGTNWVSAPGTTTANWMSYDTANPLNIKVQGISTSSIRSTTMRIAKCVIVF